jgi:hypothetical protein
MTRTREQWNAEIDAYAAVAGLSASAVADWKVLRDLCVSIAMFFEVILDLFKNDVNDVLNRKQFGSLFWYVQISKEFQSGDSLSVVDGIVGYDPVNETHRIVTQASAKETPDGVLVLKVAKTVANILTPLSGGELSDFKDYIHERRSPGVKTTIDSLPPDLVKYSGDYLYDTLYDNAQVDAAVQDAILSFRNNFRFDAVFYVSELIAVISNVPGVVSVNVSVSQWDVQNAAWLPFTNSAELTAGYFNWDNTSSLTPNPAP